MVQGQGADESSGRDAPQCMTMTRATVSSQELDLNGKPDFKLVTVTGTVPLYSHEHNEYVSVSAAPVCVNWQVSTSPNMTTPVSQGTAYTSSDIDYTIKVS